MFLRLFSRAWSLPTGSDRLHVKCCEIYDCHKPIIESVCLSSRRYVWVTLSDRRASCMIIIQFSFPWNVYMGRNFITKRSESRTTIHAQSNRVHIQANRAHVKFKHAENHSNLVKEPLSYLWSISKPKWLD